MKTKKTQQKKLSRLQKLADQAMKAAARQVIEENKRLGEPLITAENGKVRKIPASEL